LQDVTGDLQATAPRMMLKIDRDTIGRFGISPAAIDDTLYDAFGERQVATVFTQLTQSRVILELAPTFQEDAASLQKLYVRSTTTGQLVPLSALTRSEVGVSPLTINHQDLFPSVTLSFNLTPGYSLGDAVAAIENLERSLAKPAALTTTFQGSAKVFASSLATQPYLIAAAIIAVYIVLGMLYESFIHPITILSTLPSAGVGALLALMALQFDFSLIAMIGTILLIGIVKKNAIMMIDFALVGERNRGLNPEESIYEACLIRYRPIMMTTMAALHRRAPSCAGDRPRIGAAAPARHCNCRRSPAVAVSDPVHDAGDLHLPGPVREFHQAGSQINTRSGRANRWETCAAAPSRRGMKRHRPAIAVLLRSLALFAR